VRCKKTAKCVDMAKDILMFEFVQPQILFCQHLCRSKPYDFLSSVEHKRYFEESCSLNRFNYYLLPLTKNICYAPLKKVCYPTAFFLKANNLKRIIDKNSLKGFGRAMSIMQYQTKELEGLG